MSEKPKTITDLSTLLASMDPILTEETYVFCSMSEAERTKLAAKPILEFREREGIALVLEQAVASALGISGQFPSRMIILNVYSSLDAVGFLAAVTARLAINGISVQPVSAFFHDHLFVPSDRALDSMRALQALVAEEKNKCSLP